ncbi:MAG TPA: nicotinamide riboside transporter PnuC [Myxococcota bacterium]|nr:nicotinamide riboside transporter PnuC [Myxococcota bacterium]
MWLVVRQKVASWPVGILNNALYLVLFWEGGLYADALLQVVYVGIALYGWWMWLYGGEARTELGVSRATGLHLGLTSVGVVFGTLGLAKLLSVYTDSTVPGWDGWTTALSLGATWMQSRKYLESWVLWIVADLFYIGLYWYKDLHLTSVVYAVFLLMCIRGYRDWRAACAA